MNVYEKCTLCVSRLNGSLCEKRETDLSVRTQGVYGSMLYRENYLLCFEIRRIKLLEFMPNGTTIDFRYIVRTRS